MLGAKAKVKDLTFKAKAKVKDLTFKAKAKDSKCVLEDTSRPRTKAKDNNTEHCQTKTHAITVATRFLLACAENAFIRFTKPSHLTHTEVRHRPITPIDCATLNYSA